MWNYPRAQRKANREKANKQNGINVYLYLQNVCRVLHDISDSKLYFAFLFTLSFKLQPEQHTFSHTKPTHFLIYTGEDPLSFSYFLTTLAGGKPVTRFWTLARISFFDDAAGQNFIVPHTRTGTETVTRFRAFLQIWFRPSDFHRILPQKWKKSHYAHNVTDFSRF